MPKAGTLKEGYSRTLLEITAFYMIGFPVAVRDSRDFAFPFRMTLILLCFVVYGRIIRLPPAFLPSVNFDTKGSFLCSKLAFETLKNLSSISWAGT